MEISAGWIDSYKSQIVGQYVDITGLPEGVYALRSVVDPDNIIREVNDANNGSVAYFRLVGERLTVLEERFLTPEIGQTPQ